MKHQTYTLYSVNKKDYRELVGRQVKNIRTEMKLTQKHFSILCSIDQAYLSRVERGKINITVDMLLRICVASGYDLRLNIHQFPGRGWGVTSDFNRL